RPGAEDVAEGTRARRRAHPRMGRTQSRTAAARTPELSARQAPRDRRAAGAVGALPRIDARAARGAAHERPDEQHRRAPRGRAHRADQARGATAGRDPPARSRSRAARARAARLLLMARRHPAPPAHPWRRFMGFAYEAVLLFGVVWFADYAFSALTQFR